jgi:hypothetical protein
VGPPRSRNVARHAEHETDMARRATPRMLFVTIREIVPPRRRGGHGRLRGGLYLAPPGERPTEGDFVRVLEIASDGEAARQGRDAHGKFLDFA